jgi:hypothetical protein
MIEMTVPMDPALRLRDHVESILASSSVPSADREEIAEELYGHLWQRWQDALAAGATALEAVETAIRSFGEASQLGHEMTGAYHSRLYATTIGVLLPAAATPSGQPSGYRGLRLLLALMAIVQFVLVGILIGLTPVRAAVFVLAAGLSIALSVLAFRAFGRAQRWALRYCQFVLAMVLVQGAASIFSAPPGGLTIPILGVLGLCMLGPVLGPQMAEWFSHSRPIGRGLTIALVAATAVGYGLPFVASALPDPTQVSASDLDLQVAAVCTRDASGGVTAIEVSTRLRWSRLDLFPYGLGHRDIPENLLDGFVSVISEVGGKNAEPSTAQVGVQRQFFGYMQDPMEPPQVTSPDGSVVDATVFATPVRLLAFYPDSVMSDGIEFAQGGLHAAWTYEIAYRYRWTSGVGPAPTDPLVVVWYVHLDRFVVQALASCERPGSGVPMELPYPLVSQ